MERFGPFAIHECLGVGAATMVHRATIQPSIGPRRELLLRRLHPAANADLTQLEAFVREARFAALLDHPNIARTYEVGHIDKVPYIALERVPGLTIERLSRSTDGISTDLALSLLIELCRAIEYASNVAATSQILTRFGHLDPSPYNLVVTPDGHLKVIDAAGIRPDAFSVAAIAWGLLAGRRMLELDADRCDELDDLIQDALDARTGRGPSVAELRTALEALGIARTASRYAGLAISPQGRTTAIAVPRTRFGRGSTPYLGDAAITQRALPRTR